ncbi:G-type lectin S-receptor-like serine/threonine-protein kinase At1g11410 [Neltuma alba]|uniref:G-type lectin S-receptor-like serine/threonine-protein kinase At1g11410 n=1 Tax=Neltuma alba TaxID=207710 RepID=UPI0010A46427|nr:G-type lectin S-receptor-like serine/threonine-protein kinase At1g11410 [Prosopis alba]
MKFYTSKELILINIPLFLLLVLHSSCHSLHRITPSQSLKDGDVLLSDGGTFGLGFFTPGNNSRKRYVGIWYNKSSEPAVVWVANRQNPLYNTSGVLSIDTYGNIILVYNDTSLNRNSPIWSSDVSISSFSHTFAELQETGNLVLIRNEGRRSKVVWQSFDYPSDTLLSYMKMGVDRKTGFNRFLTSWKSPDDPGLGNATRMINPTGYPQMFIYKNGAPFWRAGSWTGQRWSGIPLMTNIFNITYIDNANEVSYMTRVMDPSVFLRIVINNSGYYLRNIWQVNENKWTQTLYGPREDCDHYAHCGSNSNCDPYNGDKFECVCLPGFEPVNPQEWNMRNGSSGCMRKKNVSICKSGEGFVKVARVKVPDTSKARADKSESISLKGCEEKCLRDCSCLAYTNVDEVKQSGCLTWHADMEDIRAFDSVGQDLYVRVDAEELAKDERKHYGSLGKKGMVTLVVISICLTTFLAISFVYWFVKNKNQAKRMHESDLFDGADNSDLTLFDLKDIVEATNNFSDTKMLGRGGFGSVYKGQLKDGMEIAVKRLSKYSGQGVEEFRNEVTLIAKLQHRNLVRILGCCVDGEEKMLIYEYLPNKSLDSFIFDQAKKLQLDWRKRFGIICGVARGILYLHQDSRLRIIHRDLKASNVLLDSTMNPKIADFGMARIFGGDQTEANTNRIVGTYGYMSPEYAMEGIFSIKSDAYSFGILLLEIVTGRKNSGHYNDITSTLVGHIWNLWRESRAVEIVDPSLLGETCLENAVQKCIQIGLLCVQEYATDRPTMLEVISMLDNDSTLPPPKKPAFLFKKTDCDDSNPSVIEGVNSVNEMSTTVVEAR